MKFGQKIRYRMINLILPYSCFVNNLSVNKNQAFPKTMYFEEGKTCK